MLHAAVRSEGLLSIALVAEEHRISRNNVMKAVQQLAQAGLLATLRGRGGGFRLARPPETITLGEIVRFTEPDLRPADCANCIMQQACGLTPLLADAVAAFLASLDARNLADAARSTVLPPPGPIAARKLEPGRDLGDGRTDDLS